MPNDQIIICEHCKQQFVFTVSEQEFFLSKGLSGTPKYCLICRSILKVASQDQFRGKDEMKK